MLKQIQQYLKTHKRACLTDIATHIKADPAAVSAMLEMLSAKGRARRLSMPKGNCGGCTSCAPDALVIWEWVT